MRSASGSEAPRSSTALRTAWLMSSAAPASVPSARLQAPVPQLDRLAVQFEPVLFSADRRHGVGHEHRTAGAFEREPQHRRMDMEAVDDQSVPAPRRFERGGDRAGLPGGERAHRVEEMREAGEAIRERLPRLLVGRHGMAERDQDPRLGKPANEAFRHAFGRERHEGRPCRETRQHRRVVLGRRADRGGAMHAGPFRGDERALEMDPEHARVRPHGVPDRRNRGPHLLGRVGDQRRQQAGRSEPPMRRRDRGDRLR